MEKMAEPQRSDLMTLAEARFEQSMTVPEAFFSREVEQIAQACWAMARRFHEGGRLIAFGNGTSATDAQHVSVEFVHPVIVGKRALPALALTNDSATISGLMGEGDASMSFVRQLKVLGRPQDIAMGFSLYNHSANVVNALATARQMGMLTLDLTGTRDEPMSQQSPGESPADYCFIVQSSNPTVIQEIHETMYHVLWELVHVFFEHKGLLE